MDGQSGAFHCTIVSLIQVVTSNSLRRDPRVCCCLCSLVFPLLMPSPITHHPFIYHVHHYHQLGMGWLLFSFMLHPTPNPRHHHTHPTCHTQNTYTHTRTYIHTHLPVWPKHTFCDITLTQIKPLFTLTPRPPPLPHTTPPTLPCLPSPSSPQRVF